MADPPPASDRVSRGLRVQRIQSAAVGPGDTNGPFVRLLSAAAERLRVPAKWDNTKLSKIRNGTQDLSLEDVACLEQVDPEHRGWFWIAFGSERPSAATPRPHHGHTVREELAAQQKARDEKTGKRSGKRAS
jgi:hypothetical protein